MNENYAKTLLYCFRHLEAYTLQLDALIEKKALGSFEDLRPCLEQCEDIFKIMEQKDLLIKIYTMIERALYKLPEEEMNMIEYKYFKQKPKEFYTTCYALSRNYYRKQIRVISKIAVRFNAIGLTDSFFENVCLKMDFFAGALRKVLEIESRQVKPKNNVEVKLAGCALSNKTKKYKSANINKNYSSYVKISV